jgi:outer membrane protein OmpA-like peptidoglycan-associated protein
MKSLRLPAVLLAVVALVAPSTVAAQARQSPSPAPIVPLVVGLVTVGAVHEPEKGDYESILQVDAVSAQSFGFTVSGTVDDRHMAIKRTVSTEDLAHAHGWNPRYNEDDPETFPGTTGGTLSTDVLNDLKTKGHTTVTMSNAIGGLLGGLLGGDEGKSEGTLTRVEPQTVPVSMLVNDRRVDLPAVHARGKLDDDPFEVYILDNAALPLVLRWSLGDSSKRMIRISFPVPAAPSHIEQSLIATGRAEIYGIYFDFAKATIRPESEAVLKEIAGVMTKNPTWVLSVEGHTDNIGGTASNQDLSVRRAVAVQKALVDRYHIAAARLTPAGFGESRPKETNDTIEGRARNRRVELAKQ